MLTLYYNPMACSLAARIALYEAGIEARYIEVDLKNYRLVADGRLFSEISAIAKVPVLITEEGLKLTESAAILQYIADLAPKGTLTPAKDDPARYQLQQWLSFSGSELHKGGAWPLYNGTPDPAVKEAAFAQVQRALAFVSAHLKGRKFLLERFTIADAHLVWALLLLRYAKVPVDEVLESYIARMMARPAVSRAIAEERAILAAA